MSGSAFLNLETKYEIFWKTYLAYAKWFCCFLQSEISCTTHVIEDIIGSLSASISFSKFSS